MIRWLWRRRGSWLVRLARDFALALRGFRRTPRHFLSAWFCIVVGVGATVTLFAVLDSVLLRPLPYADEDRLIVVQALRDGRSERFAQLTPAEVEMLAGSEGLSSVGTWRTGEREIASDAGFPEKVVATAIDRDLWALLGVSPIVGRLPGDGERDAVVLSHRLWHRRFSGDETIVGRTIEVAGVPHRVAAVMPERYREPQARAAVHDQLMQRLQGLPGVTAVSASFSPVPLDGPIAGAFPFRMAHQPPERLEDQRVSVQWVESGYARALGADLVDGRDLVPEDTEAGSRGALVNRAFVGAHLATDVAVGTYIHLGEASTPAVRIVGVIDDVRHERQPADVPPTLYAGAYDGSVRTFLVRAARGDAASLAPAIRRVARELDPSLVVSRLQTHPEVVERAFWRERLQRDVLSLFAGVALILALSGVYGVLSYMVAQRTHEFGVRVALGASSPRIVHLVLREAAVAALAGVAIGLLGAAALNRVLAAEVHGLPPFHPSIAATMGAGVLVVALVAALGPTRRAAQVDPLKTLEH